MTAANDKQQKERQMQRMLVKIGEQEQLLQHEKQVMAELATKYPQLVVPARQFTSAKDLVAIGNGSFACVFSTSANLNPDARSQSSDKPTVAPSTTEQLDTKRVTDQDNYKLKDSPAPGKLARNLLAAFEDPAPSQRSVLKVLQLPIGAKGQVLWKHRQPKPREEWDINYLCVCYDELRWQRLFRKEIQAMVLCSDHPCIPRCFGWCLDDPHWLPTICMEYAGPRNFWHTLYGSKRLPNQGPISLTWEQSCAIYFQLLDTIDYMHFRLRGAPHRYCMHRDISPGNIMISWPAGLQGLPLVKLVDFGLSEIASNAGPLTQEYSQGGCAVGPDVMFIDPLMWTSKRYGRGTDIFYLGQIMLLLLFGAQAAHKNQVARTDANRNQLFEDICRNRYDLRQALRAPAEQALANKVHALEPRWQSCPKELLQIIMNQARLMTYIGLTPLQAEACTTAGQDALHKRPLSRVLIRDLITCRNILSPELAALLPTSDQYWAGKWKIQVPPAKIQPDNNVTTSAAVK